MLSLEEEVERRCRLFDELPEGKYVWFSTFNDEEKSGLWFAPNFMIGKSKASNDAAHLPGWTHIASHFAGFELWGSDCGTAFAFKVPDQITTINKQLRKAIKITFDGMVATGKIIVVRRH